MSKVLQMSTVNSLAFIHIPVLTQELIKGLDICPGGHYLDATVGGGGHSRQILETYGDVQVTAIDRDEVAIAAATTNLADYNTDRLTFWTGNFADYDPGNLKFDGIIADLGVSSPQLDSPERGFSFRLDAPLDMRMDRRQSTTAADIINSYSEIELANLFYNYGEERLSRQIAKQIVKQRPFFSTTELAEVISRSVPPKYRYGRIHPATRVFQGLRIAVNQELDSLESFLAKSPSWLKTNGIIGIISFHSLEDRIVKHQLRASPLLKVLTKKPIIPQSDEQAKNPRSRSAKLRLAQRKEQ
ncbi:S-adenosyl-methyltransferase MraW [Gloeothece citriformis PCC 7424]|uniref:Ribosomal RNA small subunit methyltransferase H n=1 Tax=Gloeothece citriformis (strain PCC 7424) TaxID=65393 RepID=RSMH_GLOC7|nr:16S rRNA (cytosine(1402)-N(4))-methyltransferase RsmH [Gloeothece citriformis]B7K9F0.1 RecName: Full=Ribosomal RNA small subunit methyltransferase H; AltName: Full=16S rRNA m(4)C1402 methyltransferase; AltName: Full=rRNA (cytosine-N(4)-)-methyltransferase RsmH [Gloeothece citriformis PCC 7424]ACK68633.1 S-adenosyl-methyltransferase MraW [Gloeothece citriformis PCC 7424]